MEKLFSLMIAEGHKNKEIADLLCISAKTVEKHRANLAAFLIALSAEKGLINK